MRVDIQLLEKIAHLSRLELEEDKKEKLLSDFNKMLEFVEKLKEVNTDGVEPLTSMSFESDITREDVINEPWSAKEALAHAPDTEGPYFKVPKVIRTSPLKESEPDVNRNDQKQ